MPNARLWFCSHLRTSPLWLRRRASFIEIKVKLYIFDNTTI